MQNTKQLLILLTLILVSTGFHYWNVKEKIRLSQEVATLQNSVQSRDNRITALEAELSGCEDGVEWAEAEVGYWGRLYDGMKERHPASAVIVQKQINKLYGIEERVKDDERENW